MNETRKILSTHEKALGVNLDRERYGAFAEIGAGMEVTRWFFRVGGAAGTVAKSMSAYDMTVSDAIYGSAPRYVSRQRLEKMLDHEYNLCIERLFEKRGFNTAFFAFADTVVARSFTGGNECHGWMGVKFQMHPRMEASQIIIHVRMLDKENLQQQEALGIIGVNLIYGACNYCHKPEVLMESLLDNLSKSRIEVDMVEFSGPDFVWVDSRLMSLKLVQLGLSNAALFSAAGEVLQPSETLYKKSILVERGSFRPVCHVNLDMLECAKKQFHGIDQVDEENYVELMELTMNNLLSTAKDDGEIDYRDFLMRADVLAACGKTVLISNYFEYYRLAAFLSRFTKKPIGIVLGVPSLSQIFDKKFYENLDGGVLEAFGRLFKNDLKLFVYPMLDKSTGETITADTWRAPEELEHLYRHLRDRDEIMPLEGYDENCLKILSREVLKKIQSRDTSWEKAVPEEVAYLIKKQRFFGYRGD